MHPKQAEKLSGIYYNKFPLPNFWQIIYIDCEEIAEIKHGGEIKGYLYFSSRKTCSLVKKVVWTKQNGIFRIDYYGQYGHCYAKAQYYQGEISLKIFYDLTGTVQLVENYLTNKIMLFLAKGLIEEIFFYKEKFFQYCFIKYSASTKNDRIYLLNSYPSWILILFRVKKSIFIKTISRKTYQFM